MTLSGSLLLSGLLLLLHYHLLSLRASLSFKLFASLSLLSRLRSRPPVHLLAYCSLWLLGASLRFKLRSLLRHLRLPRGFLLDLSYLLLLKRSLGRLTLLFFSLLTRLFLLTHLLLLTHLFTLLCCAGRLSLAFGSPLLFHLLLLLSLLRRRGCLLLSLGPLLFHLLPRLLLLSLLLRSALRWLLSCALLFAHKLTHFATRRLVTLLSAACEFTHPLRLS